MLLAGKQLFVKSPKTKSMLILKLVKEFWGHAGLLSQPQIMWFKGELKIMSKPQSNAILQHTSIDREMLEKIQP